MASNAGATRAWPGMVMAGVFFILALALYREHSDWPAAYHHDEPGKVAQLVDGERNWSHPMFLLESTEVFRWMLRVPREDAEGVLRAGRLVSAGCMALAVAVLAWAAAWRHSLVAGLMVGFVQVLAFRFYEVAHYFKEDTPFLLGWALVMWGLLGRGKESPAPWRSALASGCAAGVALSAKYAGAGLVILVGLVAFWGNGSQDKRGDRRRALGAVAVGVLLVVSVVHARQWLNLSAAPGSVLTGALAREVQGMVYGHDGIGLSVPHSEYLERLWFDLGWHGWLLLACWAFSWRRLTGRDAALVVLVLVYLALLSFSPKYSERYLLPVCLVALYYVGLQMGLLVAEARRYWSGWAGLVVGLGLILGVGLPGVRWLTDYRQAFAADSREALCVFLEENPLPEDALLATDVSLVLSVAQRRRDRGRPPWRVWKEGQVLPETGTLEELKAAGVTHVVLCYDTFHRYLAPGMRATPDEAESWRKARVFYDRLRRETPLWMAPPRDPKPLHPGLELYAMPAKL